ncbi:cyclase family protein [Microbacterium sp. zg.Y909]|uniref:cyclase family protein n=1 Tax=Microbacterium sp. zg.Y909 TaxID=2969413 RepID=UPI00214B16D2|nr:cyclase family protein [Microbacterium sp. zg.Y909]MCR2824093.1 cyclase family protein [Microbacterium sp. zg.Y909]
MSAAWNPRASEEGETPPRPELSNWGRWGEDDEAGAANLLSPEVLLAALTLPRSGEVVQLSQVIGDPKAPRNGAPPQHFMLHDAGDYLAGAKAPSGFQTAVDHLSWATHGSVTHLDALGHVWYDDQMFNGYDHRAARSNGLRRLGIDKAPPFIGRGVLIDIAKTKGVTRLDPGYEVTAADIEEALQSAGEALQAGDCVLIRTGWITAWESDDVRYHGDRPGIGLDAAEYLARHDVALVGADNSGVEVIPWAPGTVCPVHQFLIRDCGIYLLEFLDLEELSRRDATAFLFIASPLRIRGGTGSPIAPVAVL